MNTFKKFLLRLFDVKRLTYNHKVSWRRVHTIDGIKWQIIHHIDKNKNNEN